MMVGLWSLEAVRPRQRFIHPVAANGRRDLFAFTGSGIFYHRAVDNGKVLVLGGFDFSSGTTYASVYSFDPGTNVWTTMTPMSVARAEATIALPPDGRVLIVGGGFQLVRLGYHGDLRSVSFQFGLGYFWDNHSWAYTQSGAPRASDDTVCRWLVLVVGGDNGCNTCDNYYLPSAEYLPSPSATWQQVGPMNQDRYGHTATGMPNGMLAVAGGEGGLYKHCRSVARPSLSTT